MTRFLSHVLLASLLALLLAACGAEDGDLTPPDVTFDGGGIGFSPTALTSVPLSGTMSADATITVDVSTGASVTGLVAAAGVWSCTVTGLTEGENIVYVTATDPVGNNRLLQIPILVDLTGPLMTISQYRTPSLPASQTVAGTVSELGSAVTVDVTDSLGTPVIIAAPAAVDGTIWSVAIDLSGQPDDLYTVTATGTDPLGNVSVIPASQILAVDGTTPTPALSVTAPALPVISAPATQTFTGTVDPACSLTINGQPLAVTAGNWTADVAGVTAGLHLVTLDACSGGSVQRAMIFTDLDPPQVLGLTRLLTAGSTDIDVDFGEEMSATVSSLNLVLIDSLGVPVPVVAAVPVGTRSYRFTTGLGLVAGTYSATLQTLATDPLADARGNQLASTYTWKIRVN